MNTAGDEVTRKSYMQRYSRALSQSCFVNHQLAAAQFIQHIQISPDINTGEITQEVIPL